MANEANTITLSVQNYNAIKNDNLRFNIFLDSIFQSAMLSDDREKLCFESSEIDTALKFCFGERYKKKLAAMRVLATKNDIKYGSKERR